MEGQGLVLSTVWPQFPSPSAKGGPRQLEGLLSLSLGHCIGSQGNLIMSFRNVAFTPRPANRVRYIALMSEGNQRRKVFFLCRKKAILRY